MPARRPPVSMPNPRRRSSCHDPTSFEDSGTERELEQRRRDFELRRSNKALSRKKRETPTVPDFHLGPGADSAHRVMSTDT